MQGSEILVQSLVDLGVQHVFGYTGAAILPVMDELAKQGVDIVVTSNEQSAAFGASGYSRSTNSVGVAVVTSGPAITNTLTAVADAFADSIPMLVIAGQVPEHKLGTDSFQHIDVSRVFGATAKKVVLVDSIDKIETIIKDSWHLSLAGKPGPVVIDFPIDLQQNSCSYNDEPVQDYAALYEDARHLSGKQCALFFELLQSAKRPLLYLGGGLNNERGAEAIRRFNMLSAIPSVNTLMAKGVLDENDPLSLGLLGMFGTPAANTIIQRNDFFFAIGVRWDDRVAEKVGFAIHARVAYIDINPEKVRQIRLERKPDFSAIGDAATILGDLCDYAEEYGISLDIARWREEASGIKHSWSLDYNYKSAAIQQAEVLHRLSGMLPDNAIVTTGVGNHQLLAAQYLKMRHPRRFLTSGSFGTMGFGLPNAVGACVANPDATVLCIDGDGSLRMNMGELHTVGTLGLPVKVLLLNNRCDGMVRNLEDAAYGGRHSATERNSDVDFSKIAKTCGFRHAHRVVKREELQQALESFMESKGPAMLEVITDREEVLYPIVPPGKSYHDMDLGPYMHEISDQSDKKPVNERKNHTSTGIRAANVTA
ncbi:MAG: thiamine pyrophosphate-binding protein [Chitinispirillaceae bacterium]|nr:thiamine pyrophosphate-binding protein [Chitinispirillaceae bacterium]